MVFVFYRTAAAARVDLKAKQGNYMCPASKTAMTVSGRSLEFAGSLFNRVLARAASASLQEQSMCAGHRQNFACSFAIAAQCYCDDAQARGSCITALTQWDRFFAGGENNAVTCTAGL